MPRMADSAVTPCPPTPASRMFQAGSPSRGSARGGSGRSPVVCGTGFFTGSAPTSVTKEGQKPSTQDRSWLQALWSMARLRPNSVSIGSTARQLEVREQSPQSSQTRGLIATRFTATAWVPRLRLRRRSVAHCWS